MPRPIWSGAISFGLVSVPIKVYSAVSQKDVSFHQIDESSGARIRYKRVSEKTGREVPYERIAKGYEIDDGRYVVIEPKELEQFAPEATRRIDIQDFVDLSEIDPIYYEHPYFLTPDRGGEKAYALLLRAMDEAEKVGIGRVVIRGKEYLAAIRPYSKKALALETMLFPDEIVDVNDIPKISERSVRVSEQELKMARQLVESLSTSFDPSRYKDEYRNRVLNYLKKKAKGKTVQIEEPEEEAPAVVDLMEALKRSVEGTRSGGTASRRKSGQRKRATSSSRRAGGRRRSA
jgi:DNA end-binding protein Ku